MCCFFFFQAEDGIRDLVRSRGLGDVYKRQTEYIGKVISDSKAFAVTTPLLTKSDGKKFGKTEEGNIWLDPEFTSPYKFYQFWINCDDADLSKLLRYFSFKSKAEIESLEALHIDQPKDLKKILAEEITLRIHGAKAYQNAMQVSELLFNRDCTQEFLHSLEVEVFMLLKNELPYYSLQQSNLNENSTIINYLAEFTNILNSKSEARRAIQGNAITINKVKISNPDQIIDPSNFIHGKYLMVENGKKNKYILELI